MTEAAICDFLADNIELLHSDLSTIQTEYYLKNQFGSDGYIDILCKDAYNNYVIIEVKKSNQTARQAIHEVNKYMALLKQNLKIRDSEVWAIIASTEWNELSLPLTEYRSKTSHIIEGYKLIVQDEAVVRCEPIPLEETATFFRNISNQQFMLLYRDFDSMEKALKTVEHKLLNSGLEDFILIKMHSENKELLYSFGIAVIPQSYDCMTYLTKLQIHFTGQKDSIIEMLAEEFEDNGASLETNSEYRYRLEEEYLILLYNQLPRDSAEILYPEKAYSVIYQQHWNILTVHRYGYFKKELRDDTWLIEEITGLHKENHLLFLDICETKFKAKWEECKSNLINFVGFNNELKLLINRIFKRIDATAKNKRIQIQCYNPDDIIWSLAHWAGTGLSDSLPVIYITIEDIENATETIYCSNLIYTHSSIDYSSLIKEIFMGDEFSYFIYKQLGDLAQINEKIMQILGVHFCFYELDAQFNRKDILLPSSIETANPLSDMLTAQFKLLQQLVGLYKKYTNTI